MVHLARLLHWVLLSLQLVAVVVDKRAQLVLTAAQVAVVDILQILRVAAELLVKVMQEVRVQMRLIRQVVAVAVQVQ
jgi:hypothetical protein